MTTRRQFIRRASTVGLVMAPLSALSETSTTGTTSLNILCVGGHPDDPESGCGGTLAKLSAAGHSVSVLYLTRGEAGIEGKSHKEAATIRIGEAEAACRLLKVKPYFLGQIDGDTLVSNEWIGKMGEFIKDIKPNLVFTHWPIDSHRDHQAASILTIQAWINGGRQFDLYSYEVLSGIQTVGFHPTDYVDITNVQDLKRKAVLLHASQHPEEIYTLGHDQMEQFRGLEARCKAAEGFVRIGSNQII